MGKVNSPQVVAVTGAAGFLGQHIVACARAHGSPVVALVRNQSKTPAAWQQDAGISVVACDLAEVGASTKLVDALLKTKVVIHAAASLSGALKVQKRDTLKGTENLLGALAELGQRPPRMVHISSVVVYGYDKLEQDDQIDETTPTEANPKSRDVYCQTKLAQEEMVFQAANASGFGVTILRPGAVYGPARMWNSHLGLALGPLLVSLGNHGQVPICHIDRCAELIVSAALGDNGKSPDQVFNILDANLPERRQYIQALRRAGWPKITLTVPWRFVLALAHILSVLPGIKRHLPGLLRPAELRARMLPVTFSNAKATAEFGLVPNVKHEVSASHENLVLRGSHV